MRLIPQIFVTTLIASIAGSARADTLWFEAENFRFDDGVTRTMTTPMRIVDRSDASGGASIEVQNGLDSKTSVPSTGRACYTFDLVSGGNYKVWSRVIARTENDDSFWARMDNGSWINWNNIAPGANWHWDFVHNESSPSTPILFSLAPGAHTFCVAYREDDTRLDLLVVTNDASFNPNAAISGAPQPPRTLRVFDGNLTLLVTWMTVLGATSYTLERSDDGGQSWFQVATGITGHTATQTDTVPFGSSFRYRVSAQGPTGNSGPGDEHCCFTFTDTFGPFSFAENLSLTSPMQLTGSPLGLGIGVSPGHNSLNSAPSSGYARLDFKIATGGTFKGHAQVVAPNGNSDSWWVRMDQGAWVKWNNVTPHDPCDYDTINNSDAPGTPQMTWTIGAGSHSFEIAYREEGAVITKFMLDTNPTTDEGFGLCFD
jgi:hypothetical protein